MDKIKVKCAWCEVEWEEEEEATWFCCEKHQKEYHANVRSFKIGGMRI